MKKIEIVKKANGVAAEVNDICSTIRDDKVFKNLFEEFWREDCGDSHNFNQLIAYYHGGGCVISDFIVGVRYYMINDADDITYEEARADLKVMKKLFKRLREFVSNIEEYNDISEDGISDVVAFLE